MEVGVAQVGFFESVFRFVLDSWADTGQTNAPHTMADKLIRIPNTERFIKKPGSDNYFGGGLLLVKRIIGTTGTGKRPNLMLA